MASSNLVADRPEDIARFLHTAAKLERERVGELLGEQYVSERKGKDGEREMKGKGKRKGKEEERTEIETKLYYQRSQVRQNFVRICKLY